MNTKLQKILERLIVLYVLLLPLSAVYIFDEKFVSGFKSQYLTGQIFITEPLLWIIVILSLIQFIKSTNFNELREKILKYYNIKILNIEKSPRSILTLSIWLFIAFSGLSILWPADKTAAYYLWFRLLEGAALFFIIVSLNIKKEKLFLALVIGSAFEGILALSQFLTQIIEPAKWLGIAAHSADNLGDVVIETSSGRWLRAYGTFSHPNILGGFATLGLIAAYGLFDLVKKRAIQLLLIVAALLSIMGLFFSFSRSAWLAALIILLIFLWLNKKSIFNIHYSIFILSPILLFIIFAYLFSPLILTRADFSNRLENISRQERISQVSRALSIIKQYPLIGTGINNFTIELQKIHPGQPAYAYQPVHNLYLLIIAELGLIGFVFFVFMFYCFIVFLKKHAIISIPAGLVVAILIIGLFDHYFWTQYIGIMLLWLSLTFIAQDSKMTNQIEL